MLTIVQHVCIILQILQQDIQCRQKKSILSFTNYKYNHPYRFAIYADFETLNKPIPCLCILCTELYNNVVGLQKKMKLFKNVKLEIIKFILFLIVLNAHKCFC